MGKSKKGLKVETVTRIRTLLRKYPSLDEMLESRQYQSLFTHYMNGYEKDHAEQIIRLCMTEHTFDEIKFILTNKGEINMANKSTTRKNKTTHEDPVEQETVFLVSQQRVVDSGKPVEVQIGSDEGSDSVDTETAKTVHHSSKKTNKPSKHDHVIDDTDEDDHQDTENDPIILGKVIEGKKTNASNIGKKHSKTNDEKKNKDYGDTDPNVANVFDKALTGVFEKIAENIDNAIDHANEAVDSWSKKMHVIDKAVEADVKAYIAKCAAENPEDYEDDDVA